MEKRIQILPSSLETIDFALFDFVNEKMNIFSNTNKGWEKVPVIWAGGERAFQAKSNPNERDLANTLIYPIISLKRSSIVKNELSKGKFYANIPSVNDYKRGSIEIGRRIKHDKTSEFANSDSLRITGKINFPSARKEKIVYEIYSMPQPVYQEMMYEMAVVTEYQQQMNEIIQPFLTRPGSIHRIMLERDGHKYEAFIQQDFVLNNNVDDMTEVSRRFETKINIKVFGYLISAGENEENPYITVRENFVEIKLPREQTMLSSDALKPSKTR